MSNLLDDRHDIAQSDAFDRDGLRESENDRYWLNYWAFEVACILEDSNPGMDQDTALRCAKSLLQSVIEFAHLPLEERRQKVDAYKLRRQAAEWRAVLKQAVKG